MFLKQVLYKKVCKSNCFYLIGIFYAEIIAKVFNGAKPRQLEQVFESPQKIALNEKTAEIIKFNLPMEFVEIIDEVYKEIVAPEK